MNRVAAVYRHEYAGKLGPWARNGAQGPRYLDIGRAGYPEYSKITRVEKEGDSWRYLKVWVELYDDPLSRFCNSNIYTRKEKPMQKLTDENARALQEQEYEALKTALQAEQNRQYKQRLDEEESAKRPFWARGLDDRQWGLVRHCRSYVNEGASGLGHQLMLIIDYMASELELADITPEASEYLALERWLQSTFGSLVQGETPLERVFSVIRHYVNQMGRWLTQESTQ